VLLPKVNYRGFSLLWFGECYFTHAFRLLCLFSLICCFCLWSPPAIDEACLNSSNLTSGLICSWVGSYGLRSCYIGLASLDLMFSPFNFSIIGLLLCFAVSLCRFIIWLLPRGDKETIEVKLSSTTSLSSSLLLLFSSWSLSTYSWFADVSSSSFFTFEEKVTPDSLAGEEPSTWSSWLSCLYIRLTYVFPLPKTADRDYSEESIDDLRDVLRDGFNNDGREPSEVLTLGCKCFWILDLFAWLSSLWTKLVFTVLLPPSCAFRS